MTEDPGRGDGPPILTRYYPLNFGTTTPLAPFTLPVDTDPLPLVHEDADDAE